MFKLDKYFCFTSCASNLAEIFSNSAADKPSLSVIEATIKGHRPDTLLIAIPINTHSPVRQKNSIVVEQDSGSKFEAISLAMALSFASELHSTSPPPITVHFLFLGSEYEDDSSSSGLGSRLFLQEFQTHGPVAMVYFDLNDVPANIIPHAGADSIESPPWLVRRVTEALNQSSIPAKLRRANISYPVRLKLPWEPLLVPYHRAGIPALRIAGEYDNPDKVDQDLRLTNMRNFFDQLLARS